MSVVVVFYRAVDADVILPTTPLCLMAVKVIEDPSTFLLAIYKLTLVKITIFYGDFRINIYEFSDKSISSALEWETNKRELIKLMRRTRIRSSKQLRRKKCILLSILYVIYN